VAACGQIGRNCGAFAPYFFKIGCNCGAFAPYFLVFSLSLPVEAAEAVFKGVQIMHITLGLADFSHCMWLYHANGEGVAPLFSYVFFTSSEKWLTPVIARNYYSRT
jgi:hypothetical protein